MTESDNQSILIRKATVKDVPAMARLINGYAAQGQMLPRSQHRLYQDIRDFTVAIAEGELIGCGALHVVWEDIAEIRSLAVAEGWRKKGVGRRLVQALLREARSLGLPRVFALTYHQTFFEWLGFHLVSREMLPHKIWGDCIDCPKFPNCDEVALIIDLDQQQEERHATQG